VEGVLRRGVHCSDSLVERMFGKIACTVRAPADIMEVDGKVEGDAEVCQVPCWEHARHVLIRHLVHLKHERCGALVLLMLHKFHEILVVVALPVPCPHARSHDQEGMDGRKVRGGERAF
jgi:hypothetical protein